ncbi:TPA: hypothetical protein ACSQRH_002076 [Clostridium perfringens]
MEKTLEEQLKLAIKLASINHFGQKDKSNKPYILHLLYVMNKIDDLKCKIKVKINKCNFLCDF